MDPGWSLPSGRPEAGPGGRDDGERTTPDAVIVWVMFGAWGLLQAIAEDIPERA